MQRVRESRLPPAAPLPPTHPPCFSLARSLAHPLAHPPTHRRFSHSLAFFFLSRQLGSERFQAPELLFDPEIIGDESSGVHQVVDDAIRKTDIDLRKTLYANIVLSGGSTMFRGPSLPKKRPTPLDALNPAHSRARFLSLWRCQALATGC